MTLYRSAVLTRTRILLDHADVTPVVTALVTGMPLPVPVDTLDTSNPHYLAFDTISDQWFLRGCARFPVLDQNRITADNDMMGAALLVAGEPDMYLDFVTLDYDGADTHAAAVVWRADQRMQQFVANDAMYFGRGFSDGVFFTSTKAAPVDVEDGSQPLVAEGADLARALFDPGFVSGPLFVPYTIVGEVADVHTVHGPDIDDRVWDEPMPRAGTDLAFDVAHPGAIIAQYRLTHRG